MTPWSELARAFVRRRQVLVFGYPRDVVVATEHLVAHWGFEVWSGWWS